MLARKGKIRLPGCPIRTSSPIRPRAFAQAMQSGIYYGYIGLVDGILERLLAEFRFTAIADSLAVT